MQKSTIRDFATSLTTTVFLVIATSGVMMYFHFNSGMVKNLHEILGLLFVVAACFHVIMNWKSMKSYFKKKIFIASFIVISIISGVFISQSANKGTDPKRVLTTKVLNGSISDTFKLLNGSYEKSLLLLEKENIKLLNNTTILSIAKANKTSPFRIIAIITKD